MSETSLSYAWECGCSLTCGMESGAWYCCWCPGHTADGEFQEAQLANCQRDIDRYRAKVAPSLEFLKLAGVSVGLDWDDSLIVQVPAEFPVKLRDLIEFSKPQLLKKLRWEMQHRSQVLVGGPANGEAYGAMMLRWDGLVLRHLARGRWAVYKVLNRSGTDRRAFYQGEATSKKKAIQLGHAKKS